MWKSEVNTAVVGRVAPQSSETVMDIGAATMVAPGSVNAAWAVNTMHHWTSLDDGIAGRPSIVVEGSA
jgi:precorrin-6B methylase 2